MGSRPSVISNFPWFDTYEEHNCDLFISFPLHMLAYIVVHWDKSGLCYHIDSPYTFTKNTPEERYQMNREDMLGVII